jgi:hypothetical protein
MMANEMQAMKDNQGVIVASLRTYLVLGLRRKLSSGIHQQDL